MMDGAAPLGPARPPLLEISARAEIWAPGEVLPFPTHLSTGSCRIRTSTLPVCSPSRNQLDQSCRDAWAFTAPINTVARARTAVDLPEPFSPSSTCQPAHSSVWSVRSNSEIARTFLMVSRRICMSCTEHKAFQFSLAFMCEPFKWFRAGARGHQMSVGPLRVERLSCRGAAHPYSYRTWSVRLLRIRDRKLIKRWFGVNGR